MVVLGNVYRMHICIPIHRFTLNRHTHARTRTCILAWKIIRVQQYGARFITVVAKEMSVPSRS